jgi:enoyl-CoA hydratase
MAKWITSSKFVSFSVARRVARITLNRPEKRNALSPGLLDELHDALIEADDRTDVHAILLEGAGQDFCAGYDLGGIYQRRQTESLEDGSYRRRSVSVEDDAWGLEKTQKKMSVIFDLHKPVVAKIQGNCLAGGTDLALYCDLIVAAEDARIGFPAIRANGSPPNHMWVYHVGPQWAKRLLLTGDCVSGRDAAKIGLVLEAVPSTELDAHSMALAERIAQVDSELLASHKRIVNMALEFAGARSMMRMAAEMDARAHYSNGPAKRQFDDDMARDGLKAALINRDAPFGDGMVRVRDNTE